MQEIYEVLIRDMLDALSIEYTQELNRFSFLYGCCHRYAYVKTIMTALEDGIQTDFYHPLRVDAEEAEEAIKLLASVNEALTHGSYTLSEGGEMVFHIAIRVENDRPIMDKTLAMRLILVKEAVLFNLSSACILRAICSEAPDRARLLEQLRHDLPAWKQGLNEIPIPAEGE